MTVTLTERLTGEWDVRAAYGALFSTYYPQWPGRSERLIAESWRRATSWVNFVLPVREEDMSYRSTEIVIPEITEEFVPRTPLGRKLLSLRIRAIQAGMTLLSADEVLEELKRRRGEIEDNEANLY